jgi:hypothetical protein
VQWVDCGEGPGGRGRYKDEREVVEVRRGEVSDVSGFNGGAAKQSSFPGISGRIEKRDLLCHVSVMCLA